MPQSVFTLQRQLVQIAAVRMVQRHGGWSDPLFLNFDIQALWRSVLSARAPECQNLKIVRQTSMAKCKALTGWAVKGLTLFTRSNHRDANSRLSCNAYVFGVDGVNDW